MGRTSFGKTAANALVLMALLFSELNAGGLWSYELGTPEGAMAGAGFAARAQDAATVFGNPAGMTRIKNTNLSGGIPLFISSAQPSLDSVSFGGGNGDNGGKFVASLGGYEVTDLSNTYAPKLKYGFNLNSYVGQRVEYTSTWAGRYYAKEAQLSAAHSGSSLAYPLSDLISIGAGYDVIYGRINLKTAVNNSAEGLPDGQLSLEEANFRLGGNIGVLLTPTDRFRFGVAYRSPMKLTFNNAAVVQHVSLGPLDSIATRGVVEDLIIPQQILAGFYFDITEYLAVMVDGSWQDWSRFGTMNLIAPSATTSTLTFNQHLKDTWHTALGLQFRPPLPMMLMAGFGYDSSPVNSDARLPSMPVDRQFRYAGGVQYDVIKQMTIGASYALIDLGSASFDQHLGPLAGTLSGNYSSHHSSVATLFGMLHL